MLGRGGQIRSAAATEAIANPDRSTGNGVAAELVGQAVDVMKIELWAHEDMIGQENLHADTDVLLKMRRAADGLRRGAADRGPGALALRNREAGSSAADAALDPQAGPLGADRRVDRIHVVERLPVRQRPIVAHGGLDVRCKAGAKMFVEHNVAAEAEKETAQSRRGLAEWIRRRRSAGAKGVRQRRSIVQASAGGGVMKTSESQVDVERTLCGRQGGAK